MKHILRLLTVSFALAAASFAGVTVSSPANGATSGSPVHVVASATSTSPITGMRVYVDNVSAYSTSAAKIDAYVAMSQAKHNVVVQAWDSTGAVFKQAITITVSGTTPTPTPAPTPAPGLPAPPSTAVVKSNIDQMTGWASCTVCAGIGANGPSATYSMVENQASPSLDGNSAKFSISGTTPYSDALWWKQLGADNTKSNFKYDVYFYLTNSNLPQALEFDVNQSDGLHKFIFGTQCSPRGDHTFDTWDNANAKWVSTGIACAPPAAFAWHHLTWEFKRTSTQVIFVGFTYDGVTHYLNRATNARASSAKEINVAFQMDGDYAMHAYSVWLDKVSLTEW